MKGSIRACRFPWFYLGFHESNHGRAPSVLGSCIGYWLRPAEFGYGSKARKEESTWSQWLADSCSLRAKSKENPGGWVFREGRTPYDSSPRLESKAHSLETCEQSMRSEAYPTFLLANFWRHDIPTLPIFPSLSARLKMSRHNLPSEHLPKALLESGP